MISLPPITAHCMNKTTHVLLSTDFVEVTAKNGRTVTARALIDSGSDSHYITNELFTKLGSEGKTCSPITVIGVNNTLS